jgi:hypothetical protein
MKSLVKLLQGASFLALSGLLMTACGGSDTTPGGDCQPTNNGVEICDGIDNDCNDQIDDGLTAEDADMTDGVCAGQTKTCDGENGWSEPDYTQITGYEADETSCDGLDNDCDGSADEDLSGQAADLTEGVCVGQVKTCDGINGWSEPDYTLITGYEATETTCDGLDNDCDGQADNGLTAPAADVQFGVCSGAEKACDGANGWSEPDYSLITGYEADETICDGLDNDCDDAIDENLASVPADLTEGVCVGQVKTCDGANGWIHPDYTLIPGYEATEVSCDGLDNDCDGQADNGLASPAADMQDGVCFGAIKVCDGVNGWIEPNYSSITGYEADEVTCDGLDNDCDNAIDDNLAVVPADFTAGVCVGQVKTCDGANGWLEPDYSLILDYEATELSCDGLDNDCDNALDEDLAAPNAVLQDGVCAGTLQICDGANGWIEPDYTLIADYEVDEAACDGLDNDCDTAVDEDLTQPDADLTAGVCVGQLKTCDGANGWLEPDYTLIAGYEADETTCDGDDNDCDELVDEYLVGDLADNQLGVCNGATKVCDGTSGWVEPNYALIDDYEVDELSCDGLDNDCDDAIDEDLTIPDADLTAGVCAGQVKTCDGVNGWIEPDYTLIPGYQVSETLLADGLDNDCDGHVQGIGDIYTSAGRRVYIYDTAQCATLADHVNFCEGRGMSWWSPKSQADAQALIDNAFAIDSWHTWIQVYGLVTTTGSPATIGGYNVTVDSPTCVSGSDSGWAAFRKWGCSLCDSDAYGESCCWDTSHTNDWFVCEADGLFSTDWVYQMNTMDQFTRCESVENNGNTCVNPYIKYGIVDDGIPLDHVNNNYTTWCQQLGYAGFGSVEYAADPDCSALGGLFWCNSYDESTYHWCDWQDGYWYNESLDYTDCNGKSRISSLTCVPGFSTFWQYQDNTMEQYTRCESVTDGGYTCVNPFIKYGDVEDGIPLQHGNNDYATWCQQLGFNGFDSVTLSASPDCSAPMGGLFWCSSYDETNPHWCDWQDGDWYNEALDWNNCGSNNRVATLTCN